jgi:hypothetical protein
MESKEYVLAGDDPVLWPGWELLEFLRGNGADEFAVRFLYARDFKEQCDQLAEKLAFALIGERRRECTVWRDDDQWRMVEVYRLDQEAVEALKGVMPGVMGDGHWGAARAWAEDLCVYRDGELVFGTVTHERWAGLRVSEEEWEAWEKFVGERGHRR